MEQLSLGRADLVTAFNQAKFQLRYFSRTCYQVYTPSWNVMPVNRLFIPLIDPGEEENYIEDRYGKHILIPGNFYFVPPYLPSRWKLSGQLNFLSIHTNLEVFPGVELFSNCSRMLVLPAGDSVKLLLDCLYSSPEQVILNAQKTGVSVYSILLSFLEHYPESDFWGPLSLRKYSRLAEYLIYQGNAQTSVSDLAELCGESRETFTRHFTSSTGITPKQLIDRYLIRRCVDLLSADTSIKEIAYQLQFSNEFAFSRYFKRLLGASPLNWKKQQGFHGVTKQ